jgi:regulatory protein YycH of two-component signal transduction system YycFG
MNTIKSILFLFSQLAFSQINGIVKDSITGKPISYVNIWVENENIGTTSEIDGKFSFNAISNKKLVFSALGYQTKSIEVKENEIFLKPIVYELKEVVVTQKKNDRKIKLGSYKKGKINLYYGAGIKPTILAKKVEFNDEIKKHPFLKEIKFLSNCHIDKAKIILRFFEIDSDGKPGQDYLNENILLEIDKGKNNNHVNLQNYNIKIPENGLFIAFEWMIIDENKYVYEYTTSDDNHKVKHKNGLNYQPSIGVSPSENQTSWTFTNGKWFPREKYRNDGILKYYEEKYGELAVEMTFTN